MEKTTKRPQNNFGLMQREALKHLKGNDLRVYIDLLTYADKYGKCYPAVETIANDIDITPRNVQKHLANLESAGWIEKNLRTNTSTMYQLYFVDTSGIPKKTNKSKFSGVSKSDGASKSDVSPLSKSDRSGASKSDVSGVSESDVLTDQLTDHNNKPQEQVVPVAVSVVNPTENQADKLSEEEKSEFEKLWRSYGAENENKLSARSAWKKYCAIGDVKLMNRIKYSLTEIGGTYMTSQMKQSYKDYESDKVRKEHEKVLKASGAMKSL